LQVEIEDRHYANQGNKALLDLLSPSTREVLDVGCGAGDNARLSAALGRDRKFYGITMSLSERTEAMKYMEACWVEDIENGNLNCLAGRKFDAIFCSHVLEHLRDPASAVAKLLAHLRVPGELLIAVPNVLALRQRLSFLRGRFEYEDDGVMDSSHLRFFTYHTADKFLLSGSPMLTLEKKVADGSVPLWFLRHRLLPSRTRDWLDKTGCSLWPNLFGVQILMKARLADRF